MDKFQKGELVKGPSVHDSKVRKWRLLTDQNEDGDFVVGQNIAAKRPYRHLLRVYDIERLPP